RLRRCPPSLFFPYTTLFRSANHPDWGKRVGVIGKGFKQEAVGDESGVGGEQYGVAIWLSPHHLRGTDGRCRTRPIFHNYGLPQRSEEHTSELQSRENLVCRP